MVIQPQGRVPFPSSPLVRSLLGDGDVVLLPFGLRT